MQRIGIILLILVGLSGSQDLLGKKRAWFRIFHEVSAPTSAPFKSAIRNQKKGEPGVRSREKAVNSKQYSTSHISSLKLGTRPKGGSPKDKSTNYIHSALRPKSTFRKKPLT